MKLMTLMMHILKKTTYITVAWLQKLSEMRHWNFYFMELKEKWVSFSI